MWFVDCSCTGLTVQQTTTTQLVAQHKQHLPIARIGVHCNSNRKTIHSRIQYHPSHRGPQIELLYQVAVPVSPV